MAVTGRGQNAASLAEIGLCLCAECRERTGPLVDDGASAAEIAAVINRWSLGGVWTDD